MLRPVSNPPKLGSPPPIHMPATSPQLIDASYIIMPLGSVAFVGLFEHKSNG